MTVLGAGTSRWRPRRADRASRCASRPARTRARARRGREDALFAVLSAAQYGARGEAGGVADADARISPPAAMLAELHAQALPRELIGALSELLTAR